MASSDFCFSPTGQSEGDSDRYLPAILYGCVPVFAWADEEGPYADLIPWRTISLRAPPKHLPAVLDNVSDAQLGAMRRAMRDVWTRLIYRAGVGADALDLLAVMNPSAAADGSPRVQLAHPDAIASLFDVLAFRLGAEAEREWKRV
eukprot:5515061-Prymnesium_polylepis.1